MKAQKLEEEVMKIMEETPTARKVLLENHENLLQVAEYCHHNYLQSGDGCVKALEETKNFTTQSLASVAYQISSLASSVLSLLDAQTNQLRRMESSINLIGQTVGMHKEKVSRREIGVFTSDRRVPRCHKVLLPPAASQPRPPYSRRPINYKQLDSLGHGIKVSGTQADRTGTIRKHGAATRSTKPPERVQCPVAPPVCGSSFGKPVAPPTIPAICQAPPDDHIITTLLDEAPPPPPTANEMSAQDNEAAVPPPPDVSGEMVALLPLPPSETLTNYSTPPPAPPLSLETVVEESSFVPPPPASDDDGFPPSPNDASELQAPPPPNQEVEGTCLVLMIPPPPPYPPPHTPSSFCSSTLLPRSSSSSRLCLPARLQHLDLELPTLPPPLLLDDGVGLDDLMPPLPPPVDDNTDA